MSRRRSWVIAVAIVPAIASVGCKDDTKKRSEAIANAADFWPEAPTPSTSAGARALTYNPDSVHGYQISAEIGTAPGATPSIAATMMLVLGFQAGKTLRSRDALIRNIDLDIKAPGQTMAMHLDDQGLTVQKGSESPTTFKRGDRAPLDVAALTDKPFTTLTFTEANQVEHQANTGHPFIKFGGDMLDTALVLFPDLPAQPVTPGYQWTTRRNVSLSQGAGRVDVTYHFEYIGDSRCPSGATSCAQITLTAASKDGETRSKGRSFKVRYGFAGKVFFDLDKGSIDESRFRMDMDVESGSQSMAAAGVFTVKPT